LHAGGIDTAVLAHETDDLFVPFGGATKKFVNVRLG
jgi:hypothetical protein